MVSTRSTRLRRCRLLLPLLQYDFYGRDCVGVYLRATDRFLMCPANIMDKDVGLLTENLRVDTAVKVNVYKSSLLGIFSAANSNGILLSPLAEDYEVEFLKKVAPSGVRVEVFPGRWSAIGNFLLLNDKGCISGFKLTSSQLRFLSDVFDVEVEFGCIDSLPYVGSLAVATNKGVLVDPSVKPEEEEVLRSILGVPVYKGTVNNGNRFVKIGLVANSYGLVVGSSTRGFELTRITEAFQITE